ncbi:MAG TPA: hypothetical protein VHP11_00625 [Tepidisphaeraceae bacterium]|nr:hypothetical protein [Tepidisphaeraceae bacterium]
MTPIATYTERLIQVRRTFTLFPDQVQVQAHWRFGRDYTHTIQLDSLKPTTRQLYIRYRYFRHALLITTVGLIFAIWPLYPQIPWPLPPYAIAGIVLTLVGLVLFALTYPKILFIRFDPHKKEGSGLDIARSGPDKARFDEFVETVRKQIKTRRNRPRPD